MSNNMSMEDVFAANRNRPKREAPVIMTMSGDPAQQAEAKRLEIDLYIQQQQGPRIDCTPAEAAQMLRDWLS